MIIGERVGEREQMLRQRDRRAKDNSGKTETLVLLLILVVSTQLDKTVMLWSKRCTYFLKLIGNYGSLLMHKQN